MYLAFHILRYVLHSHIYVHTVFILSDALSLLDFYFSSISFSHSLTLSESLYFLHSSLYFYFWFLSLLSLSHSIQTSSSSLVPTAYVYLLCVCYFRSFFLSIPKTTPANNLGAFSAVWRTFSERLHKSKHVKMEFKKRKKKKFERRTKRTNELTHIYIHLEMFTSIRILHEHQERKKCVLKFESLIKVKNELKSKKVSAFYILS